MTSRLMFWLVHTLAAGLTVCLLPACQSDTESAQAKPLSEQKQGISIHLNQLGFLPQDAKVAVIVGAQAQSFIITDAQTDKVLLRAPLSDKKQWAMSGEWVSIADFSQLSDVGHYVLTLGEGGQAVFFSVRPDVYGKVHDASLKAYYFNRASMALDTEYAGQWSRNAGHPDTSVMVHQSAASEARPAGTLISAPKGWYDAGDYGKYVVNSGISTYTLLLAYAHQPQFYTHRNGQIPESNDQIPDILNEIKWNLDWLAAMQDPNDGGVYHKLTTLKFSGSVMPEQAQAQRYVVQKSTAAALNFAAVMAFASQVYSEFNIQYPSLSEQYKEAAISAWKWAKANPDKIYIQPKDLSTGGYGDKHLADEFAFAAAQLFVLTEEPNYLTEFLTLAQPLTVPNWGSTAALGYYALLSFGKNLLEPSRYQQFEQQLFEQANNIVKQQQTSAYQVPMELSDFVWGSNAVAMNKAMLLLIANQHKPDLQFRNGAIALTDYILGRNPTGYNYVTGFGIQSPMHIHHRPSQADEIDEPIPGFLAGGAQNGWQDQCVYPSKFPALSYVDDFCSYSTNEIAINWNAPLVYVMAALQAQ